MDRGRTSHIAANLFELIALAAIPCYAVPGFLLCRDIATGALIPALLGRLRIIGPLLGGAVFVWPAATFTLALGYAILAGLHYIAGLELQPLWFRCIAWAVLAMILTVVPLDGLAFFPIGALLADLCINRRPSSYLAPRQATV
jgi:hypothetical protein